MQSQDTKPDRTWTVVGPEGAQVSPIEYQMPSLIFEGEPEHESVKKQDRDYFKENPESPAIVRKYIQGEGWPFIKTIKNYVLAINNGEGGISRWYCESLENIALLLNAYEIKKSLVFVSPDVLDY